jgi:hypothetical protein
MEKFYSKVQDGLLLHIVYRLTDFRNGRFNIVDPDQFIQCSALKFNKGKTFQPHKHIIREVTDKDRIAQESWVVLNGSVRCTFYDIDDTIIAEPILLAGDASFTLYGGHTYTILENNTRVLEMKTGRYYGQELDKTFINGSS